MKFPLPDGTEYKIPYIKKVVRRNKAAPDKVDYYFVVPGHEIEPIPHRPTNWPTFRDYCESRIDQIKEFYRAPKRGTFADLADHYRGVPPLINEKREAWLAEKGRPIVRTVEPSIEWMELKPRTRKDYSKYCDKILGKYGSFKVKSMDAEIVRTLRDTMRATPYQANYTINVLSAMLRLAVQFPSRYGIETNVARLVPRYGRKSGIKGRTVTFELEDDTAFLARADEVDPLAALYHRLLSYLAQRPGDTRQMMLSDYDQVNGAVFVNQDKTDAKIWVKAHKDLIPHLDAAVAAAHAKGILNSPLLPTATGGFYSDSRISKRWRNIARHPDVALGHMQPRDNRTTAVVRMAEAGATIFQVCSVSGHSLQSAENVIRNHYWKRTAKQSAAAIAKLEDYQDELKREKKEAEEGAGDTENKERE